MEPPYPGAVYWITGLPGVGKATLARTLAAELVGAKRPFVLLLDDRLRPVVGERFGMGLSERRALAMVYARLCHEFSAQGLDVVCTTACMDAPTRAWAQTMIPDCREIHLRASAQTVAARLPKGLVAAALAGRVRNVSGVDLPMDPPDRAEVLVDDDGARSAGDIAAEVVARLWPGGSAT